MFGLDVLGFVFGVMFTLMFAGLYFLPLFIAVIRKHHQTGAIFVLDLLAGWTFIGWVGALVWACTEVKRISQE
ncbi:MAG: superinfection immunity protein [Chlorobiaceae bacterium]|nr:superinfection immunity protein [Chlorobiaceae bacterium]